ncbi:MAG: nicotinic acid mononucleotide adenyltransferase [Flavobacteriaceae bacterium]|nr:MAG: nicotinic acid mononucleotide adenyltransferase [Flavobacteriaceae bacterium]
MKNSVLILMMMMSTMVFSQKKEPVFTKEGDLVKATYYNKNGAIKAQGFFKDKKLTGEWVRFDKKGNKIQIGYYKKGKKVGKWFFWNKKTRKEVTYANNKIAGIQIRKLTDIEIAGNQ